MKKLENLSPSSKNKIEKMYRAVSGFLRDGVNVSTIKVSDITERAGIGKGTAYEYFQSKEEIIANAIDWNMEYRTKELTGRIESVKGFRDKIHQVFHWIEDNIAEGDCCMRFFKAKEELHDTQKTCAEDFCCENSESARLERVLDLLWDSAVREGRWEEEKSRTAFDTSMISAFIGYFVYLSHMEQQGDITREELKEFIYKGLLQSKL